MHVPGLCVRFHLPSGFLCSSDSIGRGSWLKVSSPPLRQIHISSGRSIKTKWFNRNDLKAFVTFTQKLSGWLLTTCILTVSCSLAGKERQLQWHCESRPAFVDFSLADTCRRHCLGKVFETNLLHASTGNVNISPGIHQCLENMKLSAEEICAQ